MALSPYHQKYTHQSDAEIENRANEKKLELSEIFAQVKLETTSDPVRIAVVGCGDKRFIQYHKEIFESFLQRAVEITTFDIVIEHLDGEENVIQHDCTLPFPGGPFDVAYAHVLLRFIETKKQWDLIKNSVDALKMGGLAIHLLDTEDYETETPMLSNGLFSVPLKKWEAKLDELGIEYRKIPVKYGLAFVVLKR
ncbi:MAG: class I SAM-dependent methyltransferase [Candidatus Pacebacteria bacterium]|nr:class I SAM-dependent methyltransferase [Candidatus Paceibacterota bacterium]